MAENSRRSSGRGSGGAARKRAASQENPELLSSDEVRTGFVSGLTFGPRAVQYAAVDGRPIFEGDIDLGSVEEVEKSNAVMRGAGLEEAVVLHLAAEGIELPAGHELLAPALLRSQTLSALHEAVHRGELPPQVALTQLQADAFVTLDTELAGRVEGIVPTATIEALRTV